MMRYQLSASPLKVGQNIIGVSSADEQCAADEAVTLYAMRLFTDYP